MPRYEYACSVCGHREDRVVPWAMADDPMPCPACANRVPIDAPPDVALEAFKKPIGILKRDSIASMRVHADMGYQSPILSTSLGVHPDQISEAKRRFPHHNFAPDGRMILSSHSERNKVMKELGFYDKQG